jgi:hypothetical protein
MTLPEPDGPAPHPRSAPPRGRSLGRLAPAPLVALAAALGVAGCGGSAGPPAAHAAHGKPAGITARALGDPATTYTLTDGG